MLRYPIHVMSRGVHRAHCAHQGKINSSYLYIIINSEETNDEGKMKLLLLANKSMCSLPSPYNTVTVPVAYLPIVRGSVHSILFSRDVHSNLRISVMQNKKCVLLQGTDCKICIGNISDCINLSG